MRTAMRTPLWTVAVMLLLAAPSSWQAALTTSANRREMLSKSTQGHPPAAGRKLAQAGPYASTFTGISAIDYQAMFDSYTAYGFVPTSLRGYYDEASKKPLYDVIFSPNAGNQTVIAKLALDNAAYEKQNEAAAAEGYILRSNSPYEVDGAQYHAALWSKPQQQAAALGNLTLQPG